MFVPSLHGTTNMKNDTDPGVKYYFKFENVPVLLRFRYASNYGSNSGRYIRDVTGDCFIEQPAGLKLARICASNVGKDNTVEYTERRDKHGQVWASGFVRNPMGF